jgi:hypothetical protein
MQSKTTCTLYATCLSREGGKSPSSGFERTEEFGKGKNESLVVARWIPQMFL